MHPRFAELDVDEKGFLNFLKVLFAQKRKTVSNNLKTAYDKAAVAEALKAAEVVPTARAETLPLEAMARLYRAIRPQAK
jgi:16S rRNA (adenine1518-N6/adenine1519-N6)-dimethyltransferase